MKSLILLLLALTVVNCGGKKFSGEAASKTTDQTIVNDDVIDDDGDEDDDDDDDGLVCPRYDLVVKSTHTSNKRLNFTFTFNAEMTETSIKGKHHISFSKSQYSSCSGNYTNTSILTSLVPLQTIEDLTGEVLVTDGATCSASARTTNIHVLDVATNTILFDEVNLKNDFGCEFGYTSAGNTLRKKILDLADGVANAKGAACN